MIMHCHVTLLLTLTLVRPALSPEATEHNTSAMRLYDAGQLAPALDEFQAAYASLPDPRLDREGREQLLGSMLATLLAMHAATGEAAPGPGAGSRSPVASCCRSACWPSLCSARPRRAIAARWRGPVRSTTSSTAGPPRTTIVRTCSRPSRPPGATRG